MEVLDALPHVSQSIDALGRAKSKNLVIASRGQLNKRFHVGGAPIQEPFGPRVQLLLVLDQL